VVCCNDRSGAQFLDELAEPSAFVTRYMGHPPYLLERLVVDKACRILWNVELTLLYVLAEFPVAISVC
jgi:hypothetical protein